MTAQPATLAASERARLAPHLVTIWAVSLAVGVAHLLRTALGDSVGIDQAVTWVVAVGSIAFGVSVFLRDGGNRITATGTFALAVAIFVGFALVLVMRVDPSPLTPGVLYAATLTLFSSMATVALVRRTDDEGPEPLVVADGKLGKRRLIAVALLVFGVFLGGLPQDLGPLPARTAYVGVVLLVASYAIAPAGQMGGRRLFAVVLGGAAMLVYLNGFFSGSGRLVVATLLLACLLVVNGARPSMLHKHIVVGGLLPVLTWFGALGSSGTYKAGDLLTGQGLKAFYAPIVTFGDLIAAQRVAVPFQFKWGSTFLDSAVFWVPRGLWPTKPAGFGTVLTTYFHPGLLRRGHSMAALGSGEWYGNFGLWGIALSVPVLAFALTRIDRRWRTAGRGRLDPGFSLAIGAVVIAGLGNYVWVGSFTYASRDLVSALVLFLVARAAFRRKLA